MVCVKINDFEQKNGFAPILCEAIIKNKVLCFISNHTLYGMVMILLHHQFPVIRLVQRLHPNHINATVQINV